MTVVLVASVMVTAACSGGAGERPAELTAMTPDQVGCMVRYGGDLRQVVGPLGPSDTHVVEPNDYTSFRIGRTASDLVIVAKRQHDESHLAASPPR